MTRVEINADGRSVSIDSATDMLEITERALAVWRETATQQKTGAGSAGFSSERRPTWDTRPPMDAR